jgi:tRNA(fMet)-specific endonuclease VapC
MALLIDSSVVIGMERRGLPLAWLSAALDADELMGMSAISLSELLLGAHLADPQRRREQREAFLEDVLRLVYVLDFDAAAARVHANLWAQLRSTGAMIGFHDLIIAATAVSNGYHLLTDNVREFERIPRLTVRTPAW